LLRRRPNSQILTMSVFLDKADQIKSRLESVADLSTVEIIVDKQKDIVSEFNQAIQKSKGGVIVILFEGYEPNDPENVDSTLISSYSVTIWTQPILRSSNPKNTDLVEATHRALHDWKHDSFCQNNAQVLRGALVPNPRFLIHELSIQLKHELN